jgi:hypothetical protein
VERGSVTHNQSARSMVTTEPCSSP